MFGHAERVSVGLVILFILMLVFTSQPPHRPEAVQGADRTQSAHNEQAKRQTYVADVEGQRNQQSGPTKPHQNDQPSIDWTNWIQAISASLTFLVTLAILWVYHRQAKTMDGQLKAAMGAANAAEMQARNVVRARMALKFPNPIATNATDWFVLAEVINVGNGIGTIHDTYGMFCDDLPESPNYTKELMTHFPDGTLLRSADARVLGRFKSPSTKDGQFFYGFIVYGDDLGTWRSRFCVQIYVPPRHNNISYLVAGGEAYNGEDYLGK